MKEVAPLACTTFPLQSQLESVVPSGTWLSMTTSVAVAEPVLVTVITYVMVLFFRTVCAPAEMATERLGIYDCHPL